MDSPKKMVLSFGIGLMGLGLGALGFALGRLSATPPQTWVRAQPLEAQGVQFAQQTPEELIPLAPGPGQGPGQRPGNQPGQQQGQGDCPIFVYQDGKLYQLPRPGQQPQPGQQPGQGQGQGPGIPGGPQELIPLQPSPGLPMPDPLPSPSPRPDIKAVPNDI